MMKIGVLETVEKLHSLQLFDDLVFYSEICFNENKCSESLKIDEQAYIYSCIGDAYSETANLCQSERWYEQSINALATLKRQATINHFEEEINVVEVRYRLHKVLLKMRRFEKAIKCLDAIPKAECPPKVIYAIAKLNLRHRKTDKTSISNRQVIINSLRCLVKQVPEAFLSKSTLILMESNKLNELDQSIKYKSGELNAWFAAKHAEARRSFPLALSGLNKYADNFVLLTEAAHYHRVLGDKRKAMDVYEKAHSLNRSMMSGMDGYAALLFQSKRTKELEQLVENLMAANLHTCETYVALAYLSRLQRKTWDAILPLAQRAFTLSDSGRQRAEVLLLKGQIYFEAKRFKECDTYCGEAHINDATNAEAYDLHLQSLRCQKLSAKACNLVNAAMEALGENNHRAQYFMALILTESMSGVSDAMDRLEKIVEKAPFMTDALSLLMHLYERHKHLDKGLKLAKKFLEVHTDANARKILNNFLLKFAHSGDRSGPFLTSNSRSTIEIKLSAKTKSSAMDVVTPEPSAHSPNNSSDSSIYNGPLPIAPIRMRRLAPPYQSRRATSVSLTSSIEAVPLDIAPSPTFGSASVEISEDWSATGASPQQPSSASVNNTSQLSISSSGMSTRATRRSSSLFRTTTNFTRAAIASMHADASPLDLERLRRRELAIRDHELSRAIGAPRDRITARRRISPASTSSVITQAISPLSGSSAVISALNSGPSLSPRRSGFISAAQALDEEEETRSALDEDDDIDAIDGDAGNFFDGLSAEPIDDDFIDHDDNDNEIEMVDEDSDEFAEHVIM